MPYTPKTKEIYIVGMFVLEKYTADFFYLLFDIEQSYNKQKHVSF